MAGSNGNGNEQIVDKRSVIKGDVFPAMPGTGVFNFLIPAFGGAYLVKNLPPDPPPYSPNNKYRDTLLSITPSIEGMWASAVNIAVTKIAGREYDFDGPDAQIKRMYDLFDECENGQGLIRFASFLAQDYFTTDNGGWAAIERASDNYKAEIAGFYHLDSLRVWRTGDPNIPIYYYDLLGQYHALKWYECFNIVSMPSSRAGFYNSGRCAAARAFRHIRKLTGLDIYFDEKITGDGYTEMEFIQGVTLQQLKDAITAGDEDAKAKGVIYYKGKLVIPILTDVPMSQVTIPLKSVPEGFDREKEEESAHLVYAKTLGIAPIDVNPRLTSRGSLGIGATNQIIDDNVKGYGQADFDTQFTRAVNRLIVPSRTTFAWAYDDIRDQKQRAEVSGLRATERATRISSQEITPAQAQQLAFDAGDLPAELLQVGDVTIDNSVSSEEKPEQQLADDQPTDAEELGAASVPDTVVAVPKPSAAKTKEIDRLVEIRQQLEGIREELKV